MNVAAYTKKAQVCNSKLTGVYKISTKVGHQNWLQLNKQITSFPTSRLTKSSNILLAKFRQNIINRKTMLLRDAIELLPTRTCNRLYNFPANNRSYLSIRTKNSNKTWLLQFCDIIEWETKNFSRLWMCLPWLIVT